MVPCGDDKQKADSQQASTTRGQWRASSNGSEPADQEERCANEESRPPKRNVRGHKAVKSETAEAPVTPAVSTGDEAKEKRKGRKRGSEANIEEDSSSSSKPSKGKKKEQTTEAAEEEAKGQTKDEIPVQANRRGRVSIAQTKKNAKDDEIMEEDAAEKRGRGQPSAAQKKKKEEQEEIGTSVDQDAHVVGSEVT